MSVPFDSDALNKSRVENAAKALNITLSDQEQWDFIQSAVSLDLQASPGSGKTSLVALKLVLLAQTWASLTRGVCVLSHTNTAKEEITARLASSPAGSRFLRYPHYIGTIQSFTNTFIALPALRSRGVTVEAVDDASYADAATRLFARSPEFATLRSAFSRRHGKGEDLIGSAYFVWKQDTMTVQASGNLPFRAETKSGKEFISLKYQLAAQGIFRYRDMFAIAERSLSRNSRLATAVAHRFPFVLLDEMQDTDDLQQRLLDQAFSGTGVIMQRVGDVNQGIFVNRTDEMTDRPSGFPQKDALELCSSRRFGQDIAAFVSNLTTRREQKIEGTGPVGKIAVLLYDESCVPAVVPAFEQMAALHVPKNVLVQKPPRILGARRVPGSSEKYPQSVSCYVPGYSSPRPPVGTGAVISLARAANVRWASGDADGVIEPLWNTIRGAVRATPPLPSLRSLTRQVSSPGGRLRALLLGIVTGSLDEMQSWDSNVGQLMRLIRELTGDETVKPVSDAFSYLPVPNGIPLQQTQNPVTGAGIVSAVAGTIQGAKGETHSATLIVECLDASGKQHDVHEVLKRYADGESFTGAKTLQRMAELIFVGASRPTHLLTFAVHRARAEPYVDKLSALGWLVQDLVCTAVSAGSDPD